MLGSRLGADTVFDKICFVPFWILLHSSCSKSKLCKFAVPQCVQWVWPLTLRGPVSMRAADESSARGAIICLNCLGSTCLELFQEQRRCKYESCDCTSKVSPIPSGYSARSTHHSKEPEAGSEIWFQRCCLHGVSLLSFRVAFQLNGTQEMPRSSDKHLCNGGSWSGFATRSFGGGSSMSRVNHQQETMPAKSKWCIFHSKCICWRASQQIFFIFGFCS